MSEMEEFEDALLEASDGIDGPDKPYNWHALKAMRTGEALLAFARSLQDQLGHMTANRDLFSSTSDRLEAELEASRGDRDVLAAEALRLEAENKQLLADVGRLVSDRDFFRAQRDELTVENARMREHMPDWREVAGGA